MLLSTTSPTATSVASARSSTWRTRSPAMAAGSLARTSNTSESEAAGPPVPRPRRHRLARAAVQPGDDRPRLGARRRDWLVVAARDPRGAARGRAHPRAAVLPALPRVLRARPAALRRRAARGLAAAALREPRRHSLPHRRDRGVRGRPPHARRRPGRARRRARAPRGRDRLLHRLRGVQARAAAPAPPVRLVPAAATAIATFFATPADFRAWLAENHERTDELWVGVHKKA